MASAFWYLEDGKSFSRRWRGMNYMLKLICGELKHINGTEEFRNYLDPFIYQEDKGDIYNSIGGFIRNNENIMFNFDLRSFAPKNRELFWKAAQKALDKIKTENKEKNWWIDYAFTTLLDMHKRINRGENPMILNHLTTIEPDPKEKIGPGWR